MTKTDKLRMKSLKRVRRVQMGEYRKWAPAGYHTLAENALELAELAMDEMDVIERRQPKRDEVDLMPGLILMGIALFASIVINIGQALA